MTYISPPLVPASLVPASRVLSSVIQMRSEERPSGFSSYSIIESQYEWNMERILRMYLEEDLFWSTRRYPYISYAVRNVNGTTRWSEGEFSEEFGYYIKYKSEYERALDYKRRYKDKNDVNISEFYRINLS